MASVTVRKLPVEVVERLKAQAKRHRRSMEAEIRAILEDEVMRRQQLLDLIEKEVESQSPGTSAEEVDKWIRASRERTV